MNREEKYNYHILVSGGEIVAAVCLERRAGEVLLFQTHYLPWIKNCSVLWRSPPSFFF